MNPLDLLAGGGQLLSGAFSGLFGAGQKRKGNELLNSLQYPTEQIPQAILENQDTARERANLGLPSEQYNQAMKNIERQQMSAIKNTQDRRGGLASIANIQQNANDASLGLDVKNAQARIQNQNNLQGVNQQVGNWQDKIWNNNVKQKYLKDYNYAMGLIGSGNQNQVGGVDKGIAGLMGGLSGLFGKGQSNYLGNGSYTDGNGGYVTASNMPQRNLSYIPTDEQLPQ